MGAYKQFLASDIVITPLELNKSFNFEGAAALTSSVVGIDRYLGLNSSSLFNPLTDPTTGEITTQYQRLVYSSIEQLYYSNYLNSTASYGSPVNTGSIYPGNNPTNLLKPVSNKVWHVTAKYILHVATIVGGVNGIVTGDTLFGTAEFGYKSGVGGFLTAITDNKAANNANLNTGGFAFTFGPSQEILTTITTPTFTGGGSLTIRASVKFELSEIIQG